LGEASELFVPDSPFVECHKSVNGPQAVTNYTTNVYLIPDAAKANRAQWAALEAGKRGPINLCKLHKERGPDLLCPPANSGDRARWPAEKLMEPKEVLTISVIFKFALLAGGKEREFIT